MRLRNIPEAKGVVAESGYVIHPDMDEILTPETLFGRNLPLAVEIGMGKGGFILGMAAQHPETGFLGVERYESVLFKAIRKMEELDEAGTAPDNVRFYCVDAGLLPMHLAPESVDVLYLNFSDPWPKARHHKRRLTSREFLAVYEKFLKKGGRLEFKTDNEALFDFSLEEIGETPGWTLADVTRDLHRDPVLSEGNVMTEYERKFSLLGSRICKLTAVREGGMMQEKV